MNEMAKYVTQGAKRNEEWTEHGGGDPIFKIWIFQPVTISSLTGLADM